MRSPRRRSRLWGSRASPRARGRTCSSPDSSAEQAAHATKEIPALKYVPLARTATLEQAPIAPLGKGRVALVSAGTSDMPVAEECAETMRMLGISFDRVYDVGVAGIHRLLHKRAMFETASMVIVIAGMEGALRASWAASSRCRSSPFPPR